MSRSPEDGPQDVVVPAENGAFDPGPTVLRVEKLAGGGRGLARHEGRVWLVRGAVPGDRVRARPTRARPRLVEADVVEVLEPSAARREPDCPYQPVCGGCPWMVLDEAEQRVWKRRLVVEALERIGRFSDVEVDDTRPSPHQAGYRNKIELTVAPAADGRVSVGFHAAATPGRIVDVELCMVQDDTAAETLAEARRFFVDGAGRDDPILRSSREPVRLILRTSRHSGRVLVALRTPRGSFPGAAEFARRIFRVHGVTGVVRLIGRPGRRGGSSIVTLAGKPWIEETLGGLRFRLPAPVFFQINPEAAEELVRRVIALAAVERGSRTIDLYGGVGVYGLVLAREGAEVVICEADPAAVACGREAARQIDTRSVSFQRSDAEHFLRGAARSISPAVVVANPPRTGFGPGVAEGVAGLAPERVVIVSCDPPTLARDLRRLAEHGYRPARVTPVDLFPQTPHIETVTLVRRVQDS